MNRNHKEFPPVNGSVLDLSDDVLLELAPAARLAAVGTLAGTAAHGLGNSLFGVLGLVELLLADADPGSPAAERLVLVRHAALELKDTLGALAGATRPALDGRWAEPLDDTVRATAAFFRRTSPTLRLEFAERYPEEPLEVAAPRATVRQLVLHLLQHAWAVAGSDGAVELEAARDGESALLSVRASGNGGDSSPGLGLLAAGALARASGGSLASPEPGKLLLRLPLGGDAAEKPRGDSAAPTMAPIADLDDDDDAPR